MRDTTYIDYGRPCVGFGSTNILMTNYTGTSRHLGRTGISLMKFQLARQCFKPMIFQNNSSFKPNQLWPSYAPIYIMTTAPKLQLLWTFSIDVFYRKALAFAFTCDITITETDTTWSTPHSSFPWAALSEARIKFTSNHGNTSSHFILWNVRKYLNIQNRSEILMAFYLSSILLYSSTMW